ncbi:uncharacterized protein [Halyomorpha halys]|uniref:uncharacterized protein n=1 Tax=Halyomorpha halys TaxID=286706 RepID=UPI0006D4E399|nr:peptidyl-prolyl cis-trans isomerase E-like [Halyomorpha halys]
MALRTYLQQERYKEHRKNILHAEKKIKTDPPILKPEYYISNGILSAGQNRLKDIEHANRQLVTKINIINRTKGAIDCSEGTLIRDSNYKTRVINNLMIEKTNKDLYDLLLTIGSKYSKKTQMESFNDRKNNLLFISRHPEIYKNELLDPLEKWSILPDKNNPEMARCNPQKRVRCFLDFEILNERKLGRMYIEIYNDFVPIAGDNFLRFVRGEKGKGYKNTKLYIIMPGIGFLGGDVDHAAGASPRSAYGKPFTSENYALKFNGPGVIASFTLYPNINFCQFFVAFQKLSFLQNQYVVIGRVIKNLRTLEMIEEFGTKSGTPRKPITITNCGIFSKK